jgi:hypothetical protein
LFRAGYSHAPLGSRGLSGFEGRKTKPVPSENKKRP